MPRSFALLPQDQPSNGLNGSAVFCLSSLFLLMYSLIMVRYNVSNIIPPIIIAIACMGFIFPPDYFLFLLVSQMCSFNVFTLFIYLIFPYTLLYTLLPFSLVKIFLQRSHGIIFLKYSLHLLTFEPFLLYLIQ